MVGRDVLATIKRECRSRAGGIVFIATARDRLFSLGTMSGTWFRSHSFRVRRSVLFLLLITGFVGGGSIGAFLFDRFHALGMLFPTNRQQENRRETTSVTLARRPTLARRQCLNIAMRLPSLTGDVRLLALTHRSRRWQRRLVREPELGVHAQKPLSPT